MNTLVCIYIIGNIKAEVMLDYYFYERKANFVRLDDWG